MKETDEALDRFVDKVLAYNPKKKHKKKKKKEEKKDREEK